MVCFLYKHLIARSRAYVVYSRFVANRNLRADLIGSYSQDITPAVPLPRKWELYSKCPPNSPRPFKPISLIWKHQLPMQQDWISVFDDIVQLISLDHTFNEEQVTLAITSGSWIEPIIWRLLTIRPLQKGSERANVIEEVCRLGSLLFLSPFWRTLGQTPIWSAALSRNLLSILSKMMIEWNELKPLLTWVLYFAAIETDNLGERGQLIFMLSAIMGSLQLQEWGDFMQIIKSVLWVDGVCSFSENLVRDEVMALVMPYAPQPPIPF